MGVRFGGGLLAPIEDENRGVVPEAERKERFKVQKKVLWKGGDRYV